MKLFILMFDGEPWVDYDTKANSLEEAECIMARKFCKRERVNFEQVSSLQGAVNCAEGWGPEYVVKILEK